jgi:acyl-CoA thioester hydrolase
MTHFYFSIPVSVRYADIDAQGHVNNAVYFSYLEQARIEYMRALGIWRVEDNFLSIGTIVAEATCSYKRPILLGEAVLVWARVSRIGTKSYDFEYRITTNGAEAATARTVQVAYDYATSQSIRVPDDWREKVRTFEHNPDL